MQVQQPAEYVFIGVAVFYTSRGKRTLGQTVYEGSRTGTPMTLLGRRYGVVPAY